MKCVLSLFCVPFLLFAGSNPKTAVAVRTPKAPKIDGVLNEPEWQLAKPITDFTQLEPVEGAEPSERTEVRILYDDEALYFACKMFDSDPSKIVARLSRRDDEIESDRISVRIDSYHDHQTNYEFTMNAAGVKVDILQYDDGRKEDESWDVVWELETNITSDGWVAEVKIPFKALRFSEHDKQEWGLQIIRRISRKKEAIHWALIRKSESGWASKFGHLIGIDNLPRSANIELLPYVVGSNKFLPVSPAFPKGNDFSSNAGADLKYRPNGGLTIDATFYPDFGQVEADPAVLNLTTFETFYPEKRPFFIEGSQIIRFTTFGDAFGPGLFYSRRIGRSINVAPPDGGYVLNQPQFATILGAAKISGKTANGLSIGVLEAVTREDKATLVDSLGGRSELVVEPLSNFSLIRLRKDVLGNSNIGMIITSVNRNGRLPANTGGLDWNLKFLDNFYRIDGFLAGSNTTDPNGNRISGSGGKINFNKEGGEHWRGYFGLDFTSKKFNINDMGFFRRPNDYGSFDQIQYREDVPTEYIQWWNISATYHYRKNFDDAELYHELQLQTNLDRGLYDDRETRGNGLYRKPGTQSAWFLVHTDSRQPVVGQLSTNIGNDQRNSNFINVDAAVEIRPASNLTFQFQLSYAEQNRLFAWVTNIMDPLASSGVASIFSERTTRQWSIYSRGSIIFTRDLTLQYYLQLFSAKGKFENTMRMNSPDSFSPYAYNQPDFNTLSMNSNVVLRWEYLPGSTVYLVWSQARHGNGGTFNTPFGDNISNTFSLPSTNVLLLKVSYWLSY
ncbi:MAG: carbohydrate binding family 9 domain-containing protein [Ignavibacteriales bacterium]|nr:carbohydrate binding family 9 domain-containing protein [Ignavibacteriales bacterium]